jgi:hypothetical protein
MEATQDEIKSGFENILQDHNRTLETWLASAHVQLDKYRLLQCLSAHDVVHALYVKLMEGERRWDKDKCPDFIQFFFKAIRSHVKNLAITQKVCVEIDDQSKITVWNDWNNPLHMEEFMELCKNKLKNDEQLLRIFNAFSDGLANKDVAKELSMNIRDVQNAKKRMLRILKPVYGNYFGKSVL